MIACWLTIEVATYLMKWFLFIMKRSILKIKTTSLCCCSSVSKVNARNPSKQLQRRWRFVVGRSSSKMKHWQAESATNVSNKLQSSSRCLHFNELPLNLAISGETDKQLYMHSVGEMYKLICITIYLDLILPAACALAILLFLSHHRSKAEGIQKGTLLEIGSGHSSNWNRETGMCKYQKLKKKLIAVKRKI